MPELGRGDVAVAVLVEVAQALDEVFGRVGRAVLADGLQDGQEDLEVDALLCESRSKSVKTRLGPQTESPPPPPVAVRLTGAVVVGELLHVRLGGVLTEGPEDVADLGDLNAAVALLVKQLKSLLEIWQPRTRKKNKKSGRCREIVTS